MISTDPELSYVQGVHQALVSLVKRGSTDWDLILNTLDDIVKLRIAYPELTQQEEYTIDDKYMIIGKINKQQVAKMYTGTYEQAIYTYTKEHSPAGCMCFEVINNIVSCSKV